MDNLKGVLIFLGTLLLTVFLGNVLNHFLQPTGLELLIWVFAILFGSSILSGVFIEFAFKILSNLSKDLKDSADRKKNEREIVLQATLIEKEYLEYKNQFRFFSNERLMEIYKRNDNEMKISLAEQLALEEELVFRKLIESSPTHEKIYAINKRLSE